MKQLLERIRHWLLGMIWYVDRPTVFMVKANPHTCLQVLATAARPSVNRLHLGNVFASGRRYQISEEKEGFRLTTTSKNYRQRTQSSTVLNGTLTVFNHDATRVYLESHIRILYLLDVFLLPIFITSIIVFVPWHPVIIALISALLFILSWVGHRSNATLEATEMVYFVQKALQDLHPEEVMPLAANSPAVVYNGKEFIEEWEKFYEAHKTERPDD